MNRAVIAPASSSIVIGSVDGVRMARQCSTEHHPTPRPQHRPPAHQPQHPQQQLQHRQLKRQPRGQHQQENEVEMSLN